jgi:hypothetical protein
MLHTSTTSILLSEATATASAMPRAYGFDVKLQAVNAVALAGRCAR